MDRRLHMVLVVACIVQSSETAAQMFSSYCGPGRYYDGYEDRCMECSAICHPDVVTDFCSNNCPVYHKNMMKQRQLLQEGTETQTPEHSSQSTTKHALTAAPQLLMVDDVPLTMMLILAAVCLGMTAVVLVIAAVFICRSCQRHSESDDVENHKDAVSATCYHHPLFSSVQHQHIEHHTNQQRVNVTSATDCSPPDNGIGSPLTLHESMSDSSERRSLLPTHSLGQVSSMSSSQDDVDLPINRAWSASAVAGDIIVQYTPGPVAGASKSN